eukprot:1481104-Prymnesium_polylepis.1
MECGSWINVDATLEARVASPMPPPAPPAPPPYYFQNLEVTDVCSDLSPLLGTYTMQGIAANGAPYYVHSGGHHSLYWDPDCNGDGSFDGSSAMWIFDNAPPDPSRSSDLDGDGSC